MPSPSDAIKRTFALPFGYSATFEWKNGHLEVDWDPKVPEIRTTRSQRKFFAAYQAARRSFHTDIAAVIGQAILIVDVGDPEFEGTEVVTPPTRN